MPLAAPTQTGDEVETKIHQMKITTRHEADGDAANHHERRRKAATLEEYQYPWDGTAIQMVQTDANSQRVEWNTHWVYANRQTLMTANAFALMANRGMHNAN